MKQNVLSIAPLVVLLTLVYGDGPHPLRSRLATWHTLKQKDIRFSRQKRSINSDEMPTLDKEISFDAFDRTFTLSLTPAPEIFAPGFKAYVTSRKITQEIEVDKGTIMKGTVLGDPTSNVTAHLIDRSLTANIATDNETYIVEPLWRHLPQPQASRSGEACLDCNDMLVYRESDFNANHLRNPHEENGFCDTKKLMKGLREKQKQTEHNDSFAYKDVRHNSGHHRSKRETTAKLKICKISLVADFRFYREMGNSSFVETMYYLINLIERVNGIYKGTNWNTNGEDPQEFKGYGFQIDKIIVHNESTLDSRPRVLRYNLDQLWGAKELLEAFSETKYSDCLSHLFTYVDFDRGLLGLAYVGSEKENDIGGICTKSYVQRSGEAPVYLNTGLTSTVNWGQKILTTEADLVTAHELGHNFGAEHDDGVANTADSCTPGQANGGNFIMYPAAVSGQYPNNKQFSECSKHNILPSLKRKAPLCFQEDKNSFCGNYQVETHDDETCDVGYYLPGIGDGSSDPCCYNNCTLKPHAKCSNKNYPCCTEGCQIAGRSKMCRAHIPGLCWEDVYCDGVNKECPQARALPDNTSCGDMGKCKAGVCEPFCQTKGLHPCLCTDPSLKHHYCIRCCAPLNVTGANLTKLCKPYTDGKGSPYQQLPNNSTCTLGYCQNGVCNKQTQDVIERVWDIFKHIAPDKIGEFLADNIVGTVLVFSLLFWIPCGCLINLVDKKRLKERQKEDRWWNERGAEYSRQSAFRSVGPGSAPATPRIRIQRNPPPPPWAAVPPTAPKTVAMAREQWRASQERGFPVRKSHENFGSTGSSVFLSNNGGSKSPAQRPGDIPIEPQFVRPTVMSHTRSPASLTSSLDDKSFESEVRPIAASSLTDIPEALLKNGGASGDDHVTPAPPTFSANRRKVLHRQVALVSPGELKDTTV